MDEEEEAELRQILRSRNQSNSSNWQEPVSVWRNDQTGEIEWIGAEDIPAETDASSDTNPWFVDEPEPEPSVAPELSTASISRPAPPAPENLPSEFLPLYRYLIDSPFVERSSISFIDAKAEPYGQGESAWTDWVVVVQMKEGREGGIRGATEAIREILSAASSAKVRTEGISSNPSTSWSMVDGGKIVVHILTRESRDIYQIEDIWTGRPSNSTSN
ncbi:uncharacterized protein MELLADRAFT_94264 [Melampsora larici-populina 98AG31]|uniref:Ribosomal silencing factor RsfS n=1 Tax=Melampsora larici-populina (strain 98AG31 / pathotype 3-4-7) TaxID=747676 RepID=F4S734_MELLP|nr:uncharacterized protein MELLADRAFT_94264 [Melampsora larici-populina 98AG31]EGF99568.1 hypothetical protein MELLADRAFT_94264 [Melampsora larici-populina 98AG31]